VTVHAITDKPSRYRIEALAHTAADVVRSLGGLLFDRRCLGWDPLVVLDDRTDIRPLQIIGADCADLEAILAMPEHPRAAATFKTHALAAARAQPSTDIAVEKFLATRAIWQAPGAQQPTWNRSETCTTVRFSDPPRR